MRICDPHIKKGKVNPPGFINQAPRHEDVRGSGGIAPPFLTSELDGDGQFHVPAALSTWK
jgi:hypothetical protein